MTEKEQEILDLYLKDLQKKRLIIALIIICVIIIGGASAKKYLTQNNVDVVSDENITQENVVNDVSNNTKAENEAQKTEEKKEETKTEQVSSKPANKDFLFTDGYTMENVTQAAQDYLKSSGHAGECIPIKDNEGIYLGMRVIFY